LYSSPSDVKAVGDVVDCLTGVVFGSVGEMCVPGCSQDADMAEDLLQFKEINAGFQHMCGIGMTKRVA
jgi:hypothetical protein